MAGEDESLTRKPARVGCQGRFRRDGICMMAGYSLFILSLRRSFQHEAIIVNNKKKGTKVNKEDNKG
jgi:hypothetical protein